MLERICSKCHLSKPVAEFPFRNKSKGTYHSYCLECGRKWIKAHYERNVQYYVRKAKTRRNGVVADLNEKIYDYLRDHPCVDCGETDPVVLEFDHVYGQKSYEISTMAWRLVSWHSLKEELAKCEVRCANCHRRKTAKERGTYRHRKHYGPLAQFG